MADGPNLRPETILVRPAITSQDDGAKTSETEDTSKITKNSAVIETSELHLNRDLTWLAFNRRVLQEAEDTRNPLLERVRFLFIASSTLDEFVMKRIGGLKQQVVAGIHTKTHDGRNPRQQLVDCCKVLQKHRQMEQSLLLELTNLLAKKQGIFLKSYRNLSVTDKATLRNDYIDNIFPLVATQAMNPAHPFPFVSNLSLNLLVTLRHSTEHPTASEARVKVPLGTGIPLWLSVGDSSVFVALWDVMAENLDLLFPGIHIEDHLLFRVIRSANTERNHETADDLLALIKTELRNRKFAPIVQLEVSTGITEKQRRMLAAKLSLDEFADIIEVQGTLGIRNLFEIADLAIPDLQYPSHHPVDVVEFISNQMLFHVIREKGSILFHHPYESFASSVERFLREASTDQKVRTIKMTLYRTSEASRIIKHLITAAKNGKQVIVALELKARFDEEANIRWANHLESFGIHVSYGVVGLKTHCKMILVLRQDFDGLHRYAHLGTGNYNSDTALQYSDLGLLTSDPIIGHDLSELFNYLTTGLNPKRKYQKLLPAPKILKQALIRKIEREINKRSENEPGLIQMKMNALEDIDIIRALYRASKAGVTVDLIVRDTCCLRPRMEGLSDNISVVSIIGRFLEHSRIFYFRNAGDEEYYISSADLMQRNLESRVELGVPVEANGPRNKLRFILDTQLGDQRDAWDMCSDGRYEQRTSGPEAKGSQQRFIEKAKTDFSEMESVLSKNQEGLHTPIGDSLRRLTADRSISC